MNRFIQAILDAVYPPRCFVCGEWTDRIIDSLCDKCRNGFNRIGHPMCTICGRPFESAPNDHPCGECITDEPYFDMHRTAGYYEGTLRDAILKFKFNGRTSLAKSFADMAMDTFESEFSQFEIDSIAPVPLHPKRLRWRGFNQSLLIARRIGKQNNIFIDYESLRRIRQTTPQARLTTAQRLENVKGAFAVSRPQFVEGRNILLVDDVSTTGATLHECSKTLMKSGAAKVYCLTVARGRR